MSGAVNEAPAPEIKRMPFAAVAAGESGAIAGYASLFGATDMAKDRVVKGAFAASLARRGASGVRLLWQHDPKEPIGIWTSLAEDERGLFARGRLNLDVMRARDAFALIRQGAVDGLSIGFRAERARADPRSGVRHLAAIDLWEISIVTFPMLPDARVAAVERRGDAALSSLAARIRSAAASFHDPRRPA
jgi:HK97 family phage prohead protease